MSRRLTVALVFGLGLSAAAAAAQTTTPAVRLTDITVQAEGEAVTVNVVTSAAPRCQSKILGEPLRLVLDFEQTLYRWKAAPLAVGADPVKEISGSQVRKDVARVVIALARKVPYTLEPHAGGLRVVFAPTTTADHPTPAAAPVAPATWRLQGIILLDESAVAYIMDPTTKKIGRYGVGDAIGDGVVEVIEERHVVLTTPRGRVELRLEEPRPGRRPRP